MAGVGLCGTGSCRLLLGMPPERQLEGDRLPNADSGGTAREKHIYSEIRGHGLVPEWEVPTMHEILLVSTPKGSQAAHQRRQLWDNCSRAEPGLFNVSSDQSPGLALSSPSTGQWGNGTYLLLRASQTSFFHSTNAQLQNPQDFSCNRRST